MNTPKGRTSMKRVLQRIASSLFVVLMGIGEAHAGFLPPIDLGEGRALKFFYEAQFGLTYRNMALGYRRQGYN